MSVKQPSLRGLPAWFVVLAMVLAVIFSGATALNASAKRQDIAEQEKDKKEEKKDEKPKQYFHIDYDDLADRVTRVPI